MSECFESVVVNKDFSAGFHRADIYVVLSKISQNTPILYRWWDEWPSLLLKITALCGIIESV